MIDEARLSSLVSGAIEFAEHEPATDATCRSVERAATVALGREQAAGHIRDFRVHCVVEDGGLALEIGVVPPAPRARGITLKLRVSG